MPAGRRGVVDQASDHPPAGAITHPAGGHSPRWRTGGSAPAGGEGAAGPGAADGSRGNTSPPRGLLAVVGGVVLHEALDELVDGAGRGPAALAGPVGQLVLGQPLIALAGLVVGLRALL